MRAVIVAGEPGGSIPATRERIETELGRAGHRSARADRGRAGQLRMLGSVRAPLHLNENEFICEVLDPATLEPVADGQPGELVVTNLGRTGSPVIRYRTGDIVVRRSEPCACGRTLARLEGGILARTDDMVNIRGVNVYPDRDRVGRSPVRRGRRVPIDGVADRARCARWRSRSSWRRRRRIRGDRREVAQRLREALG